MNEKIAVYTEKMQKSLASYTEDLAKIRTGRASISLLDDVRVEAYGTSMPLNQVASLTLPESRMIAIQPWDAQLLGAIEKAIHKADLGLTPVSDGKIIRITVPQLTEERRKELVKQVRKVAEEYRVAIRNIRREANEAFKKMKKEKEISEDDQFKLQDEIQKVTDEYIKKIDTAMAEKEKEVMEV